MTYYLELSKGADKTCCSIRGKASCSFFWGDKL